MKILRWVPFLLYVYSSKTILAQGAEILNYPVMLDISLHKPKQGFRGEINTMIPFFPTNNNLTIIDVRLKKPPKEGYEYNLGLVYRHNFNDKWIFGFYNYFDQRKTINHLLYKQWTIGTEILSEYLDARINLYHPENKKKLIAMNLDIQKEVNKNIYEQALPGFDFEIGTPIFSLIPKIHEKLGTKVFLGKYFFRNPGLEKVSGTRIRIEQKIHDLEISNIPISITLNIGTSFDQKRKRANFAGINFRIPLGLNDSKKSKIENRMMDPIIRDINQIVTQIQEQKIKVITKNIDRESAIKAVQERHRQQEERLAATKIQAVVRGKLARNKAVQERQRQQEERLAATKIQAIVRGKLDGNKAAQERRRQREERLARRQAQQEADNRYTTLECMGNSLERELKKIELILAKLPSGLSIDNYELIESSHKDFKLKSFTDRNKLKEAIMNLTFDEEITHDKLQTMYFLNTKFNKEQNLEKAGQDIYKRILTLINSSNMSIIPEDNTHISLADAGIPTESYLTHGARILFILEEGSGNELLNWITSGNKDKVGISTQQDQNSALKENQHYVYSRPAGTHSIIRNNDGKVVGEGKGFFIGLQSYLTSYVISNTEHYGMDLALGAVREDIPVDILGNKVKADGDHGHLYIKYLPPEPDKEGGILLGIEASGPQSKHHSILGSSDDYTATYGTLWEGLRKKALKAGTKAVIGKKYNGRIVKISRNFIDKDLSEKEHKQQ